MLAPFLLQISCETGEAAEYLIEMWWGDMADWKKWPAECRELLQEGVEKEMANCRTEEGRTTEEITRWRDDKLLKLLQLLNRI
jgi:carnitine 3-dehydrogenase